MAGVQGVLVIDTTFSLVVAAALVAVEVGLGLPIAADKQNVAKDTQAAMALGVEVVNVGRLAQVRVEAAELAALVPMDRYSAIVGLLARVAMVELEDLHL
jgi:hypothetical protein